MDDETEIGGESFNLRAYTDTDWYGKFLLHELIHVLLNRVALDFSVCFFRTEADLFFTALPIKCKFLSQISSKYTVLFTICLFFSLVSQFCLSSHLEMLQTFTMCKSRLTEQYIFYCFHHSEKLCIDAMTFFNLNII